MIYVNQKQLEQVEYLIDQSSKGHHVLFDIEIVRAVFKKNPFRRINEEKTEDNQELNQLIEKHIENLILQPNLGAKKAYLENLTDDVYERVIQTYFSIVENNIFESQKYSQ